MYKERVRDGKFEFEYGNPYLSGNMHGKKDREFDALP